MQTLVWLTSHIQLHIINSLCFDTQKKTTPTIASKARRCIKLQLAQFDLQASEDYVVCIFYGFHKPVIYFQTTNRKLQFRQTHSDNAHSPLTWLTEQFCTADLFAESGPDLDMGFIQKNRFSHILLTYVQHHLPLWTSHVHFNYLAVFHFHHFQYRDYSV